MKIDASCWISRTRIHCAWWKREIQRNYDIFVFWNRRAHHDINWQQQQHNKQWTLCVHLSAHTFGGVHFGVALFLRWLLDCLPHACTADDFLRNIMWMDQCTHVIIIFIYILFVGDFITNFGHLIFFPFHFGIEDLRCTVSMIIVVACHAIFAVTWPFHPPHFAQFAIRIVCTPYMVVCYDCCVVVVVVRLFDAVIICSIVAYGHVMVNWSVMNINVAWKIMRRTQIHGKLMAIFKYETTAKWTISNAMHLFRIVSCFDDDAAITAYGSTKGVWGFHRWSFNCSRFSGLHTKSGNTPLRKHTHCPVSIDFGCQYQITHKH